MAAYLSRVAKNTLHVLDNSFEDANEQVLTISLTSIISRGLLRLDAFIGANYPLLNVTWKILMCFVRTACDIDALQQTSGDKALDHPEQWQASYREQMKSFPVHHILGRLVVHFRSAFVCLFRDLAAGCGGPETSSVSFPPSFTLVRFYLAHLCACMKHGCVALLSSTAKKRSASPGAVDVQMYGSQNKRVVGGIGDAFKSLNPSVRFIMDGLLSSLSNLSMPYCRVLWAGVLHLIVCSSFYL